MIRIKDKKKNEQERIDLVYLWVDGEDPKWQEKKRQATGKAQFGHSEIDAKGRYVSNDELKFSLRSLEKHISWIGKIFIVTDNQIPEWLKIDHPQINIIDHSQILPKEVLPCFNSRVIEYALYKIPGLSEHFLFANDDMLFNRDLKENFFFKEDGFPIVRMKKERFGMFYNKLRTLVGKKPGNYRSTIYKAIASIKEKFRKNYYGIPHHNIDAYKKTDYKFAVEELFNEEIKISMFNRVKSNNDVQRFAFSLYALAIGHAYPQYVNKNTSLRNQIYKDDADERMQKYNPALFCMNDNQKATDEDRKAAKDYLEKLFPEKSSFER
ncbi:MAG TPA: Stealth CR1 domain-containing protein [Chitinophagaceae bacterium]|nr:Stealth CR1 domain-containing protein [Chitinophagaceae bacterium]